MNPYTTGLVCCPTCDGERVNRGVTCGTGGCRPAALSCYRCEGSGMVPREMLSWMELGERLRDRRVNAQPYRNQRTEAARLGIDVVRLSRLEQGLEPGAVALLEEEEEVTR